MNRLFNFSNLNLIVITHRTSRYFSMPMFWVQSILSISGCYYRPYELSNLELRILFI